MALTPSVARQLVEHGNTVWVEKGAGERAMFQDDEYIRAGAHIAYSLDEVIHRSELVVKVAVPDRRRAGDFPKGTALMAFYHMAVKARQLVERLLERSITAIGYEVIESDDGPAAGAGRHQRDCRPDDDSAGHAPAAVQLGRTRHSAGGQPGAAARARGDPGGGYGGDLRGPDRRRLPAPGSRFWTSTRTSCAT